MNPRWFFPLLAGLALAPIPARAGDRTVEQDLAAVKSLMREERWTDAAAALRRTLDANPGHESLSRNAGDIEEDLRICQFRAQEPPPRAADLFGPRARTMDALSRRVAFEFPDGPEAPYWEVDPSSLAVFKTRFEGEVTLEFSASEGRIPDLTGIAVMFCFDPEKETGYLLTPGYYWLTRDAKYFQDGTILRMEGPETTKDLVRRDAFSLRVGMEYFLTGKDQPPTRKVTAMRTFSSLSLDTSGGKKLSASDSKFKGGYVGIRADRPRDLKLKGVVEPLHFKSLVGAWTDRRFREWTASSWDRTKALPEWLLRGKPAPPAGPADHLLPSDQATGVPADIAAALDCWQKGDMPSFLEVARKAKGASPRTRDYLDGLSCLAEGRRAEAVATLDRLIRVEPDFAPALLYRGVALLGLREIERARRDLDAARPRLPSNPDLWTSLAMVAAIDGDLDRAHAAILDGRAAGAAGEGFTEMAAWVLRSRRGPAWAKRFEAKARNAVVSSDHSILLCNDIGRVVDLTLASCNAVFHRQAPPGAPIRVYAFSSREGYLAYSGELGRSLENASGAYIDKVRELVLYVPEIAREEFWGTVRHESFHAFVHDAMAEVPPWFDEGWAQCMERGKVEFGTVRMAPLAAETLPGLGKPLDLPAFMQMDHDRFMENPATNYPLSQALVTFLFTSESPRYRDRLEAYFESLRRGLSPKEAFEKDFQPVIEDLAPKFRIWVRTGAKVPGK